MSETRDATRLTRGCDVIIERDDPPTCEARLGGELDLLTAPDVAGVLDDMHRNGRRFVVLDLSGLSFVGAAGLGVLVDADRRFRADGGSLVLVRPGERLRAHLRVVGLDSVLTIGGEGVAGSS